MRERLKQAHRLQVGMRRQVVDAVDARGRQVQTVAQREAFVGAHLPRDAGHVGIQFGHPGTAFLSVVEIVFARQILAPDGSEKRHPVVGGVRQHRDMPVGGRRRFATAREQARVARLRQRRIEAQAAQVLGHGERHHGFQHRYLDMLALAAALAMKQRRQHRVDHRHAGGLVGDQAGREVRLFAIMADQRGHAAGGLDHVVERRPVGVRPILTEAGGHAVDDVRLDRGDRRIAQAQALDRLDAHVVHQHVDTGDQPEHGVAAGRALQVDRDRALVAVDREVDRTHAAVPRHAVGTYQVALQAFDLDHVGTVVAEDLGGQRAQHHRGEVQYANPGQGAG